MVHGYNQVDDAYFDLLRTILVEGRWTGNRTGIDTKAVFGAQAKFDVDLNAFPILTTKKVWFKGIVHELLWFIKGDTNIKYLVDNDVHIWDEWAYKRYTEAFKKGTVGVADMNSDHTPYEMPLFIHLMKTFKADSNFVKTYGELGEGTYGGMWRNFPSIDPNQIDYDYVPNQNVDQLKKVVDKLKTNPMDRRMIVSAWHPYWVDHCALPPCHCLFHFNTQLLTYEEREKLLHKKFNITDGRHHYADVPLHTFADNEGIPSRKLNLLLYQRSCDTFLGVPFNITSYALLLAMVAHVSNMVPGVFTHTYGDLHIYKNHQTQVKQQMEREPKLLPRLWLNPKVKNLFDFKFEDIKLVDYNPHPAIKADVAV